MPGAVPPKQRCTCMVKVNKLPFNRLRVAPYVWICCVRSELLRGKGHHLANVL